MIAFVTAYDEATRCNLLVLRPLIHAAMEPCVQSNATRAQLLDALSSFPNRPIFLACHGGSEALVDQDGSDALNIDDLDVATNRPIFAFACNSAESLGPVLANEADAIYFGFCGSVSALDAPAGLIKELRLVIRDLLDKLASVGAGTAHELVSLAADRGKSLFNLAEEMYTADESADVQHVLRLATALQGRLQLC